jgi:cytochrome b subunit of formate dehydrogenase
MWPRWKDACDLGGMIRYWLGWASVRPKMGRFGYAEKAEYWALVWGTVIMGITGFMLWFPVASLFGVLPRWSIDAATVVHFYEAILATLAILVWHFYQVLFNPGVHPLNLAFLDGKMSDEQYRHEHPLDWEALQASSNPSIVAELPAPAAGNGRTRKDEQSEPVRDTHPV